MSALAIVAAPAPPREPDATYSPRAMWLRMYAEGGRWSRAELIDVFGVDACMDVDLWEMVAARQVRQWGQGVFTRYGVTHDCSVPPWLTVAELQAPIQAAQTLRGALPTPPSEDEIHAGEFAAMKRWPIPT